MEQTDYESLGVYTFVLEAQLSDMDLTYSEATFKLAVVDPCVNAIVNSDGALQLDEEFIAPQEAEIYESVFYD